MIEQHKETWPWKNVIVEESPLKNMNQLCGRIVACEKILVE